MDFPYPRLHYGIRTAMLIVLLFAILYFLTIPNVDKSWLAGFFVVYFTAIVLASVTPMFTAHGITDDGIRLRQGVLLDTLLQFADIESVDEFNMKIWRFGLLPSGAMGRIVLANGNRNLVAIKLRSRKRFPMLLWRSGDEIIIDLLSPGEFVKQANLRLRR